MTGCFHGSPDKVSWATSPTFQILFWHFQFFRIFSSIKIKFSAITSHTTIFHWPTLPILFENFNFCLIFVNNPHHTPSLVRVGCRWPAQTGHHPPTTFRVMKASSPHIYSRTEKPTPKGRTRSCVAWALAVFEISPAWNHVGLGIHAR